MYSAPSSYRLVLVVLALSIAVPLPAVAQEQGRVTGRVLDGTTGSPLAGAVVELVGSSPVRTTVTSVDGRYFLPAVPAGTIALRVRRIGYRAKLVTGIAVSPGEAVTQDVALDAVTVELEEIAVTAAAERGSVANALMEQRTSANVINAITAEEIRRGPDSDAAAAAQRVSGVTVQSGRYVFVRGLGERYTTTSLNGLRIPSPEPERRVVPLDLFPASLLEAVSTAKTFTPDLPGDFSGADVNLRTREFSADRHFSVSVGTGLNTRVLGQQLPHGRGTGLEWLGLASRNRQIPPAVRRLNFASSPTQAELNAAIAGFRNAWTPAVGRGAPALGVGLSAGGRGPLLGRSTGYLLSFTYSWDQEVQDQQIRARALPAGGKDVIETDRYEGRTGRGAVLWGGLLNLSTELGRSGRLAWSTTYNRSADHDARSELGESENLGTRLLIRRMRYVERSALSTQLAGEHLIGFRHRVDWSAAVASVTRREPDRSEIVYALDVDAAGNPLPPAWFSISNEGAVRTFASLEEHNWQGALHYRLGVGSTSRPHALKLGLLFRATDRDADNTAYAISANLPRQNQELAPEQIFDGRFAGPSDQVFRLVPLGEGGSYRASDRLAAGYLMGELFLSRSLVLVTGARIERSQVTVDAAPTVGQPVRTTPAYTDVLPSVALTAGLGQRHQVRLAASQTVSRPEYRELAPVLYREVIGGDNVYGNPGLRRARIQNYDLRWEFYPSPAEVVSVAAFAKRFDDPIEQVYLATSGTRIISFLNAEGAWNYGLELEGRKNLQTLHPALLPWTVFANATLMRSRIEIGSEGLASRLNDRRPMVGQAPFVVNAGLTYTSLGGRWSATALYNVVGRRIVSAGEAPLPDVYEEARHSLDFSLRLPITDRLSGKVDAKNLLDAPTRLTQGAVIRESWYAGRKIGVGLTWTP
jgi:5-hydroxyisourate hydrolase-like protein (transthyretin family)